MKLRHLRYFVAVAEQEHFGRAAARLRISAPPLSQQIKNLEQELGVALFEHAGRRVRLTDAGRRFLPGAKSIIAAVGDLESKAQAAARGEYGEMTLGYSLLATSVIPPIASEFCGRHPRVDFRLLPMWSDHASTCRAVGSREITAAWAYMQQDEAIGPELKTEKFRQAKIVVALPRGHALAVHQQLSLEMLRDQPIVVANMRNGDLRANAVHEELTVDEINIIALSPHILRIVLVKSGMGITFLIDQPEFERPSGVELRPVTDLPLSWELRLIWRAEDDRSVLVRSLREIFRNRLNASDGQAAVREIAR